MSAAAPAPDPAPDPADDARALRDLLAELEHTARWRRALAEADSDPTLDALAARDERRARIVARLLALATGDGR